MPGTDGIKWTPSVRVLKYSQDQTDFVAAKLGILTPVGDDLKKFCAEPEDGIAYSEGNLLTTAGLTAITALLIGTTPTTGKYPLALSSGTSYSACGVGSSSTAATVADLHLGGDGSTTTAYYQAMDSGYPTASAGVITGQCSYATGNANFAWNEWCFASGTATITAGGTLASIYSTAGSYAMWNHKIQSLGTKSSGTWVLVSTLTLA